MGGHHAGGRCSLAVMAVAMLRQLRPLWRAISTAAARMRGLVASMMARMSPAGSGVKVSNHRWESNGGIGLSSLSITLIIANPGQAWSPSAMHNRCTTDACAPVEIAGGQTRAGPPSSRLWPRHPVDEHR